VFHTIELGRYPKRARAPHEQSPQGVSACKQVSIPIAREGREEKRREGRKEEKEMTTLAPI